MGGTINISGNVLSRIPNAIAVSEAQESIVRNTGSSGDTAVSISSGDKFSIKDNVFRYHNAGFNFSESTNVTVTGNHVHARTALFTLFMPDGFRNVSNNVFSRRGSTECVINTTPGDVIDFKNNSYPGSAFQGSDDFPGPDLDDANCAALESEVTAGNITFSAKPQVTPRFKDKVPF